MGLTATDMPSQLNAAANGNYIEYSNATCDLGEIAIARSSVGICAILFGSDANELRSELAACLPNSKLTLNEDRLRDELSKVVQFVAAPKPGFDLALDIRGTPFQLRVWHALRTIPFGRPLTYAQLARRVSGSKSLRAIAQACAENPIALAIPCHRVMGHSGSTAGYRWGVERKRALINREVAAA